MFSEVADDPIRSFDVIMFNMIRRHFLKKKLGFHHSPPRHSLRTMRFIHSHVHMQTHTQADTCTWSGPSAGYVSALGISVILEIKESSGPQALPHATTHTHTYTHTHERGSLGRSSMLLVSAGGAMCWGVSAATECFESQTRMQRLLSQPVIRDPIRSALYLIRHNIFARTLNDKTKRPPRS